MLGTRNMENQKTAPYATPADFCRIFKDEMDRLYLLSFLLTADHSTAEKCFVRGLENSRKGNRIFKEWADSWARRTIIQNAIRILRPKVEGSDLTSSSSQSTPVSATKTSSVPGELAAVLGLAAFDRFAFVMSVLERWSDQECSVLLGCTRSDVTAARLRALLRVGAVTELQQSGVGIDSGKQSQPESRGHRIQLEAIFPRAVWA